MRDGADEVQDALLAGDPADEQHEGHVGVDAEASHAVRHVASGVLVGVDAVVDHMHAGRVDGRIAGHDVVAHALADRDHRVGRLERRLLAEAGQGVAAAELLGLPRPQGLQAVARGHVRDGVAELREVSGEVRVPGVGVDHVDVVEVGAAP